MGWGEVRKSLWEEASPELNLGGVMKVGWGRQEKEEERKGIPGRRRERTAQLTQGAPEAQESAQQGQDLPGSRSPGLGELSQGVRTCITWQLGGAGGTATVGRLHTGEGLALKGFEMYSSLATSSQEV